jgi:DNA-directed RNA polymerase subunit beta'
MVIRKQDCGVNNGIALNIDDESLKGRVLAKDVAGFKAGEFITRGMLHALRTKGVDTVIARSALTCGCSDGLCAKCVGKFYKGGKLPKIGDAIGASVSTSASEPVTQMALSAKHTAGMTTSKRTYSGLGTISQFTQSPEKFKDQATVSELDGTVEDI